MLTKAYIQEVISPHSIRVRIPLYNKISNVDGATPDDELAIACVCNLPNFITDARAGDIVIVGFEEDVISKPVVLGYLSTNTPTGTLVDIECNNLTTHGDAFLTEHTTIGEIKPDNIKCLKDLKDNVNDTFKITDKRLTSVETDVGKLKEDVVSNAGSIVQLQTDMIDAASSIGDLSLRVDALYERYDALQHGFDKYLKKYPTVLGTGSYGSALPTGGQDGQIYFTLKKENE